ncbi:S1C family serine protease [Bifidobacterium oedipodis]|uniref:Peptidase n=1 Tax=Bifidobacterium oedipodis TaxID=2675322 RepID=A0A7Y0EQX5_9BIFI|nr:trypsin-like peptidase domain-containing protein [Bifidobacterium sp. DSM 109957]NMM94704.1 peptidase [Bifidobacterium sp. DSM 109957]
MADETNGTWNAENGDQNQPTTSGGSTAANADNTTNTNTTNNETNGGDTAVQTPVTSEPAPDYASAKGESTVVSNAPTQPINMGQQPSAQEQPTAPLYRPAPEFGAYGPVPTSVTNAQNAQNPQNAPTQRFPFGGQPQTPASQNGQQPQGGNRNPYFTNTPFSTPAGQQNAQNAQSQNNGNPFINPNGQNGANNGGQQPPTGPFGAPGVPNGPDGQPAAAKRGMSKTAVSILSAVIAAVVAVALSLGLGFAAITNGWVKVPTSNSLSNVSSNKSGSGSATAKSGEAADWQAVASSVSDSVVAITTQTSDGTAQGSGAILDTEGHIVTNNHVISGAQQITVTLSNGTMYSAQVVGTDTTTDLAVIKLDNPPSDLKAVEFADSDKLAVGEGVMAIGNPLGYDDTATTGIVSALNRPVSVMDDNNSEIVTNAVQIDAAINPGNSGGPTFNAAGQVIGINSSIASTASSSSSAGSIGIGFAIPSNLVKRVAEEIVKDGSVKHVALGVTIKSTTVTADGVTRAGSQVSNVVSDGPGDKAGIKSGDTIVAFNGNAVSSNYSLLGFVRAAALGDKATLTLVRNGKTMDVEVTLDQEESAVNGSNRSESNNNQNQQNQQNQQDQQDQDGNSQSPYGDGGGLYDPFGLW